MTATTSTTYVIPARRVLTVVHIKDPDVAPEHRPTPENRRRGGRVELTADSHDGATLCGEPMLCGELWQPWAAEHADRMCQACEGHASTDTQEEMF